MNGRVLYPELWYQRMHRSAIVRQQAECAFLWSQQTQVAVEIPADKKHQRQKQKDPAM
jgi:hypothetical protein